MDDEQDSARLEEIKINSEESLKTCILQKGNTKKTRPDTRQSSRGRLGRSSNAKIAILEIFRTNGPTDGPTRKGVESRVRD